MCICRIHSSVRTGLAAALIALLPAVSGAQPASDLVQRSALRVCADPANLPFSDKERRGFENKLADLLAAKLGVPVLYTWFPQTIGFVRNTLGARQCDIIMGYAQGDELVQNTNHYYRSAYALIYPVGSSLDGVDTLGDARLKDKHIGVVAGTPPASILAANGLMAGAKPYQLIVDRRYENPAEEMINDIEAGRIDAGLLWGRDRVEHVIGEGRDAIVQRLEQLDHEWDIDRALMVNFAIVGGAAYAAGVYRYAHRPWFGRRRSGWLGFFTAQLRFLLLHGTVGWCPPLPVFRRLGVRTKSEIEAERRALLNALGSRDGQN